MGNDPQAYNLFCIQQKSYKICPRFFFEFAKITMINKTKNNF